MTKSKPKCLGRLDRVFYRRDAITVARGLLGQRLVHYVDGQRLAGIIVETEAYLGVRDKAAHSYNGRRTERTETMYADGGTVYVFLNYGLHNMFNIVVREPDVPEAVLIRAIEPTEGLEVMQVRRTKARKMVDLCSGPGKVGAAFAFSRSHNGIDLTCDQRLYVEQVHVEPLSKSQIAVTARIGVEYAEEWSTAPLRFYLAGNPHISGAKSKGAESFDSAPLLPIAPEK